MLPRNSKLCGRARCLNTMWASDTCLFNHAGARGFAHHSLASRISGHSTRIGGAQELLRDGASIAQIMAKVGWTKVDTVMRYVGLSPIEAINRIAEQHR